MTWTQHPPILRVVTQLLQLRLRAERLGLLRKIQLAEAQARAAGLSITELQQARVALARHSFVPPKETTLEVSVPRRGDNEPLRHLTVSRVPGSKF